MLKDIIDQINSIISYVLRYKKVCCEILISQVVYSASESEETFFQTLNLNHEINNSNLGVNKEELLMDRAKKALFNYTGDET